MMHKYSYDPGKGSITRCSFNSSTQKKEKRIKVLPKKDLDGFKISYVRCSPGPYVASDVEIFFRLLKDDATSRKTSEKIAIYVTVTKEKELIARTYSSSLDLRFVKEKLKNVIYDMLRFKLSIPIDEVRSIVIKLEEF